MSNSKWVISLKSTGHTLIIIPSPDLRYTVLPTNQVPWRTYYIRNLKKEVGSSVNEPAQVQDFEPLRDQAWRSKKKSVVARSSAEVK
ncbi:E3 ubiquitin-protein ligase PRT1 isoform X2 [Cucumis melo var. makuwa]|uniref:E3 ubiquitin-protein ligase PRT1 isoform X2 n=1 Tax=Cucumis melo var. makuwa TaxID=1194695 RepID=A0A5A7V6D4_CUCMM|nr:E3 ubiquitin-protein ligase PRT1 isoform X2 [Cucumis melo var. makuwa]TYJ96739.1 E3 ubiquitin-protein ligase PRT1 isoform X2 [Cucumis melo var. makuwa]